MLKVVNVMCDRSMLYPVRNLTRRVYDMSGMWNFQFDFQGLGVQEGWQNKLPSPIRMPVPASFSDFFTDKDSREYCGDFWYETDIFIPSEWTGMDIGLRFEAATHRATVYINGEEAGTHEGGFLPFTIPVNDHAQCDQLNRISVRVNNELREDCLPVGRTATLPTGHKMAKGYFDFFNYAGLIRPVKLVAVPKEHIVDFSVRHSLLGGDAQVEYTVTTTGGYKVVISVFDEDGLEVSSFEGKDGALAICGVRLWEVHSAYLYTFRFRILDGDAIIDEYAQLIGIRTFEVVGDEFLLNGKPVYLKGFGKHEEGDITGRGLNLGLLKRDFELMKWCGANSFRTAHYPCSEEVYQLADREGILIIDETPAVGLMASTLNFFDAASGPQTAFFQKETTPQLLQRHLDALHDLINRDKNYACVVAWCLANEPETTDDEALPYMEKVFARALELDPQRRPRTFTSLMTAQPDKCKCYQVCDFISLNRYYGWYVFGGAEIGMGEMAFRHEMRQWAEKGLDKPFMFTEYGADTHAGEHKLPSMMWTQEYQEEYLAMCHRVFDSYPLIKGEQVWAFSDFQTGEGIMRLAGNKKGIFTRERQPKAAAYFLKKRWESLPVDYKSNNK